MSELPSRRQLDPLRNQILQMQQFLSQYDMENELIHEARLHLMRTRTAVEKIMFREEPKS